MEDGDRDNAMRSGAGATATSQSVKDIHSARIASKTRKGYVGDCTRIKKQWIAKVGLDVSLSLTHSLTQ
jgi:hypothetical protein